MRRGTYTSTFPSLSPVNTTEDIRPNRIHDGFLRKDATQNSECKRALFGAAGSIRLLEQRQCAPRVDASRDDRVERGDVQVPNVDAAVGRHTPEHRRHVRGPAPQSHRAALARSMPRAIPAPREYARVRERLVLRRKGGRYVIVYTCPRACTRHQCGMRTEQPVQRERAHNGEDDTSGSRRLEIALQVYGAC